MKKAENQLSQHSPEARKRKGHQIKPKKSLREQKIKIRSEINFFKKPYE